MGPYGTIWDHMASWAWGFLEPPGGFLRGARPLVQLWDHLGPYGTIWGHLGPNDDDDDDDDDDEMIAHHKKSAPPPIIGTNQKVRTLPTTGEGMGR